MSSNGTTASTVSIDFNRSIRNEEESKTEQIQKLKDLIKKCIEEETCTETALTEICKLFCIDDDYVGERNCPGRNFEIIREIDHAFDRYREIFSREDDSSESLINQILTGKYITKDVKDWITPKKTVLKRIGNIQLVPSTKRQEEKEDEFSSEIMRDEYIEAIKIFGLNFAEIIKILPRVNKNEPQEHETETKDEKHQSKKPFYSIVTCISCPTSMWESNLKDLSDEARCHLDSIDNDLCNTDPQNLELKVKIFFKTFGSHIFNGSVHFGGIYVIETSCFITLEEKASLRREHTRRKRRFKESLCLLNVSEKDEDETHNEEDEETGRNRCDLQQFFKTNYRNIGGPENIDIFHIWRMVVNDKKSVWKIIDTNELSMENFLGIWTIIRDESFKNAEQLSSYLCKIWKENTGFDQEQTDMLKDAQVVAAREDFVRYIEHEIPQLIEDGESAEYLSFINRLHRKVQNLQNTSWHKDIWKNQLKENNLITDLFLKILNGNYTDQQDVQMRHQVGSLIDLADVTSFRGEQLLRKWLSERKQNKLDVFESYSMRSISDFVSAVNGVFIDLSLYIGNDNEHTDQVVNIEQYITDGLNKAVAKLSSILIEKKQWLQYALLITWLVPIGFNIHSEQFQENVTYDELTKLALNVKEHLHLFNELQRANKKSQEAWVIRLLVFNILRLPEKNHFELDDYMDMFCKRAKANFVYEIKTLVSEEREHLSVLHQKLTHIIEEPHSLSQSSVVSWEYFEDLQEKHQNVFHCFDSSKNKSHEVQQMKTIPGHLPTEMKCLLDYLGLADYFPEKITLDSVLAIQDFYFRDPKNAHELPWFILKDIIAMNFEYREKILVKFVEKTNMNQSNTSSNDSDLDLFELISGTEDQKMDNEFENCIILHPVDVCLAVFLCCNPFLKSVVVQKMAACQFAIPLVYKNVLQNNSVFSIWPLREVYTDIENESVASQVLRVVSFIRVGECSFKSKSQMINTLLRDQYLNHETFYHKDCALGTRRRMISNGSIEMSWFVPSKDRIRKTKDMTNSPEMSSTGDEQKTKSISPKMSSTGDEQKTKSNSPEMSSTGDEQKTKGHSSEMSSTGDEQKKKSNSSEMSSTGDEQKTKNNSSEMSSTGDEQKTKSSSPEMSSTGDEQKTKNNSSEMSSTGDEQKTKSSSPEMSSTGDEQKTKSNSPKMSSTGDGQKTKSNSAEMSSTGDDQKTKSNSPEMSSTGDEQKTKSNSSEMSSTGDDQKTKSNSSEMSSTGDEQKTERNSPKMSSTGDEQKTKNNSSEMSSTGDDQKTKSNSSEMSSTGDEQRKKRNSPEMSSTGDEQKTEKNSPKMSSTGDDQKTKRNSSEMSSTGDDQKTKSNKPEMSSTGDEQKKKGNSPEMSSAGDDQKPKSNSPEMSSTGDEQKTKSSSPEKSTSNDELQCPLTLLNLRGSAVEYEKETDLLIHMSNAIVIFVDSVSFGDKKCLKFLKKMHKSNTPIILIIKLPEDQEMAKTILRSYFEKVNIVKSNVRVLPTFDVRTKTKLNLHEIKKQLIKYISFFLKNQVGIKLQDISENLPEGFVSDENSDCKDSKALAESLLTDIKLYKNYSCRRDDFLPLHGSLLWHEWSRKLKLKERTGNKGDYDVNEKIPNQMNDIRKLQIQKLNKAPPVISRFVEMLLFKMKNENFLLFFLFWIRQSLDNESRIILPLLTRDLCEKIERNESLKTSESAREVEDTENKLSKASFGIEHFFREIGQIYEAFWYSHNNTSKNTCEIKEKTSNVLTQLPRLAAQLLLLGQPLELMDGDAANVPMEWIRAVFKEIKSALGDKKFFVISVLGVQSSGKSTFLNAMFGLQYPVKAGRCTRGLFFQLIPVSNASSLKYDFAMVIDTEGLRAPEKAGKKINHDNELATFVIGLGDVIVINIKGENLSDMADVLQIVVHALMRLQRANSNLKLQQSVMFVHHNICSVEAKNLTVLGNTKTIDHLNEMTKEAAYQEHMEHISSFRDIIDFDPLKHVWYVSDLLHGHGTMAPVSSAYCQKSFEVSKYMLYDISLSKNHFSSAADIFMHFESLWKGILAEDFVFSFQNCLEVKAYNLLEAKYQELIWKIEEKKLKWVNENVQRTMEMSKDSESLADCEKDLNRDFELSIIEYQGVVEIELSSFLEKAELKDQMINWKESKFRNIAATVLCLTADVTFQIKSERDRCSTLLSTNDIVFEKVKEINKTAKTFAENLRGHKQDAAITKKKFESLWISWLDQIAPETTQENIEKRHANIESEITKSMYVKFDQHAQLLKNEIADKSLSIYPDISQLKHSIHLEDVVKKHINVIGITRQVRQYFMDPIAKYGPEIIRVLDGIFESIDADIDLLLKQDTAFDATEFSKILQYIKRGFEKHNGKLDKKFTLTPSLQMKIVAHVSRFSFEKFCYKDEQYEKKFSLRSRLQGYKVSTYKMFKGTIDEKTNEIIVANILKAELKILLREDIAKAIPIEVQRVMRQRFKFQKHFLIKELLISLANKKDFLTYIEYIENTETFVLKWIQRTTDLIFFQQEDKYSKYTNYVQQILSQHISTLHESIRAVTKTTHTNVEDWIMSFKRYIKEKGLIIPHIRYLDYTDKTETSINNFDEFSTCMIKQLYEIETELSEEFNEHTPNNIKWPGKTPYEYIFEGLWGCRAVCPWCNEPCQKSDIKHADFDKDFHTCIQHRPDGISGMCTVDKDILVIESCNYQVQCGARLRCGKWCNCSKKESSKFHPMREYQKYIPQWKIMPSIDMSTSKYWSWVMMSFIEQFAFYYDKQIPVIPESWEGISKEIATKSLSVYYEI